MLSLDFRDERWNKYIHYLATLKISITSVNKNRQHILLSYCSACSEAHVVNNFLLNIRI